MNEDFICSRCHEKIQKSESSVSIVKNLKKLYYHARCFGADHLEEKNTKEQTVPENASEK